MKGKRILRCDFRNFYEGKPFHCEITLHQPDMDSMVIATPWKEKRPHFTTIRKSIACVLREMSALTVTQYTLIHRIPSEHWIGGVGYGPMTTPGTGETETALWKENRLASMSATALVIRQRPVKIYCCMICCTQAGGCYLPHTAGQLSQALAYYIQRRNAFEMSFRPTS